MLDCHSPVYSHNAVYHKSQNLPQEALQSTQTLFLTSMRKNSPKKLQHGRKCGRNLKKSNRGGIPLPRWVYRIDHGCNQDDKIIDCKRIGWIWIWKEVKVSPNLTDIDPLHCWDLGRKTAQRHAWGGNSSTALTYKRKETRERDYGITKVMLCLLVVFYSPGTEK